MESKYNHGFFGQVIHLVGASFCTPKKCGGSIPSQDMYLGCRFDPNWVVKGDN